MPCSLCDCSLIKHIYLVLSSLMVFYEGLHEKDTQTPNEAKFRAYYIIMYIREKDIERQMMDQPMHIFAHSYV